MTDRILPKAEKFASCPYDEKILAFYEGQFESVYVLLHPFLKPTKLAIDLFNPSTWPNKHEIINGCVPVTWAEILKLSGLQSLSNIDVGLRTSIGGLSKDFANSDFAEKLNDVADEHKIIHPTEGDIPPLLENRLHRAIKELGHNWLWVGDEFGRERKLHWIDDLIEKDEIPICGCVFTHDHSLLVTNHWDSHCSFLCASKALVEKILAIDDFEGFYCTPKTEVYWSVHEM